MVTGIRNFPKVKRIQDALVFLPCQVPEVMFPVHFLFLVSIFPQESSNKKMSWRFWGPPSFHSFTYSQTQVPSLGNHWTVCSGMQRWMTCPLHSDLNWGTERGWYKKPHKYHFLFTTVLHFNLEKRIEFLC